MGGIFGLVSKDDCVADLFYGTDYHSHFGTKRGGMTVINKEGFIRYIHNIENAQFRSKFEQDIRKLQGNKGVGVISDTEDQPVLIKSHLGSYAIVTVGAVKNIEELAQKAFGKRTWHFAEISGGLINPTEMVATLINQGSTFEEGIRMAQEAVQGSCTLLLLTEKGIYAARDKLGRTPLITEEKSESYAVTMETCAFPNLGYKNVHDLGPGEIVFISDDGIEQKVPPREKMQICGFLWVYYGYPASSYEGINVESVRYKCGAFLAKNDDVEIDLVAGIPDSGTGHGLGYAAESGIPFQRPFVKYTPTWPRSFMPQDQRTRDLVAKMKLIPIEALIKGKRLLFCEDSIVRGTQLQDTIQRLFDSGAEEVHMRPACPPLTYSCKFLHFSVSRSELDLAARRAIEELGGEGHQRLDVFSNADTEEYAIMIEQIKKRLKLTTLKYQKLSDLVTAIGLPKDKVCTYCWDGSE